MVTVNVIGLIGLTFMCNQVTLGAPVNDQKAVEELQSIKTDIELAQLQIQLEKLQKDLKSLQLGKPQSHAVAATSSQNGAQELDTTQQKSVDDSSNIANQRRRGGKKSEEAALSPSFIAPGDGLFYDRPVVPSARVLDAADDSQSDKNINHRVGWQPLKRVAEPSSPDHASFHLSFSDGNSLRQEMMATFEDHLMRDLEAARKYGIEPQEILQDLRQKHNNLQLR